MNSKYLLLSNRPFIDISRTCFTLTNEEFLIWYIVNMFVAIAVRNKIKISFFQCANFLLFCRHNQKYSSWGNAPNSIVRIGVWAPLKNTTPFSLAKHPLNLQTVQSPFLDNPPPWFFVNHPPKSQIVQWTPKILKFFILKPILSFKSNLVWILSYDRKKHFCL